MVFFPCSVAGGVCRPAGVGWRAQRPCGPRPTPVRDASSREAGTYLFENRTGGRNLYMENGQLYKNHTPWWWRWWYSLQIINEFHCVELKIPRWHAGCYKEGKSARHGGRGKKRRETESNLRFTGTPARQGGTSVTIYRTGQRIVAGPPSFLSTRRRR